MTKIEQKASDYKNNKQIAKRTALALLVILSVSFSSYGKILKKKIPDNLVVFSFDDATASQYSVVAPLLKEFGFGATFFVCEFPSSHRDSLYLNWKQIKALDKMGFEVANHTRTHPPVSKLSKEKFIEELGYIEHKCDSMGIKKPSNFAYPGYDRSLPVLETLQEKGYQFARIGDNRAYDPLKDHPFLVPSWATNAKNKEAILAAFNQAKDGKIVVLTIHGVPDVEHSWVNTPPELFKEYLQYLSDHHFKVISFRELSRYVNVNEAKKTITPKIK
ncbi:MAG: polysaccharide deacetylase family protein [Bacteroidales bacterium]|nr:polysaccharide deacetylase family protein [Bacteroidales bacterium]